MMIAHDKMQRDDEMIAHNVVAASGREAQGAGNNNNNNNRRLVTLAEHTSDHGRQTNSSTEEKGEQVKKAARS